MKPMISRFSPCRTHRKWIPVLLAGMLFIPAYTSNTYAEETFMGEGTVTENTLSEETDFEAAVPENELSEGMLSAPNSDINVSDGTAQIGAPAESKGSIFDSPNASTGSNGYTIGIDPGHQGEWVDMSASEENGPGSSDMKMKCTTGTQGTYTGIPEYELNLQISLQLRDELEARGYNVVLTRTDNDTAISNKERALYAAECGANIYVRIHANGDDSHTASGALTMSPSPSNPYVPHLYEESNRLSQILIDNYCAATGFNNLGIQYTDTMTGINWSQVPVTILEMGFMTHDYDDHQMADPEFQKIMVNGIANGIDAYFGITRS